MAVFVCFSSRDVLLEIVKDLKSNTFILCHTLLRQRHKFWGNCSNTEWALGTFRHQRTEHTSYAVAHWFTIEGVDNLQIETVVTIHEDVPETC